MEKKFTKDMVCKEFSSKCRECPLFCDNNFKSLPCWLLDESDIQFIMKDYPYADVKIRMIFNDIETRLAAVEEKVSNNVSVEFKPERVVFGCSYNRDIGFSAEVVAKNLYDKLEAKHEADCRLISEYDLEIKRLEEEISALNKQIDSFGLTCRLYEKETKDLKSDVEDLKNAENERDHYKGLYSSKCDDYDALLEKQLKTEKEVAFYRNSYHECCSEKNDHIEKEHDLKEEVINLTEQKDSYKNLFHSLNHKHQKVVGEMKRWKERAIEAEKNEDYLKKRLESPDKLRTVLEREIKALEFKNTELEQKLKKTEEKFNDACVLNKMREDVFEANLKLKKTIEAKDREIDLLRAELDKYKTDDECDDRWID